MEIPDLVRQELGDEDIQAGVNLGDEDTVCFTPTRTLVYRGEGLLSDEKVTSYPTDFERLKLSEARRKTKFTLFYPDQKLTLAVPGDRTDPVFEQLLEGSLRLAGVLDEGESIAGVFRFSELTLVVTDNRLLKHLGSVTWDADFEFHAFDDVTGLDFEKGSVATAIVLTVEGRPERIKAPAEQARTVRKTLQNALFTFHEVSSLEELNAKLGSEKETQDATDGIGLEAGIDPLVGNDDAGEDAEADQQSGSSPDSNEAELALGAAGSSQSTARQTATTDADLEALEDEIAALTEAVEQQSQRIDRQERTIQKLIEELRQGR